MINDIITTLKEEVVKSKGIEIDLPEWGQIARQLDEIKRVMKALKEKEDNLKHRLILLSDGISRHNREFAFECSQRAGGYDYAKVVKDYFVDLEPYKKESVIVWKLSKI